MVIAITVTTLPLGFLYFMTYLNPNPGGELPDVRGMLMQARRDREFLERIEVFSLEEILASGFLDDEDIVDGPTTSPKTC